MPIIDLQRRMREVGRIRMGDKKGNRPNRLDKFRLTSADRTALEAAASVYGGEVRRWQAEPGQFELYVAAEEIPILAAPVEPTQWYEHWSGGGCLRRCDGETDHLSDGPCQCDPEKRECKMTTRVSVMLPDLPSLGVWRLETHGYYAATELPVSVEMLVKAARNGEYVPATLAIEQRTVKRSGETKKFPVPVIRLRRVLSDVLPIAGQARPSIEAPAQPSAPALSAPARELPPPTEEEPGNYLTLERPVTVRESDRATAILKDLGIDRAGLDRVKAAAGQIDWRFAVLEARRRGADSEGEIVHFLETGETPWKDDAGEQEGLGL